MEAQLSKLKVPELKALLSKHDLPQTGKKDDLVKRLVENNISAVGDNEELVDPETNGAQEEAQPTTSTSETQPTETPAPAATVSETPANEGSTSTAEKTLSPEEEARKRRAERFGLEFKPNPTKTTAPASSSKAPASASTTNAAPAKKEKPGAIDKSASLGISDEVLAARAAKFGLPDKKAPAVTPVATEAKATPKPEATVKPAPAELTPEMKEQIAAEEEKKRKRAEKFGTGKPASTANGTEEPDAKKAKA